MLALLLIWFYILVVCFICGWGAAKLFMVFLKEDDLIPSSVSAVTNLTNNISIIDNSFTENRKLKTENHITRLPLSLLIISGLCFISTITGYLSLFLRIGLIANCIIFLASLFLIAIYHKEIISLLKYHCQRLFALNRYVLALLFFCSLFILLKSVATPSSYDTGLYHAQAIRWIEEYPVIPGLGNLHSRLAFNSAWFLPNALFGFSFLKLGPFHALNGFLTLMVTLMSLGGLSNLIKGEYRFSNILRAGILLPAILVFKDQLSSPTPDIAVALLTCLVFIYYIRLKESAAGFPRRLVALGIVLLSTFAIIIKLSALPLALLALLVTVQEIVPGRPRNWWLTGGAALLLILPFFLRNIWLSGYLLYPLAGLDLFNFDWKIPEAVVLAEKRAILEFARDPGNLAPLGAVKSPLAWIPYWFSQLLSEYGRKLEKIFLPSLLLLLDWLGQMFKMRTLKIDLREIGNYKTIFLTAGSGLAFWFLTAPDPRFAMGFLMVGAIIIFIPFLKAYNYHVTSLFPWSLGLVLLYFLVIFAVKDFPLASGRLWRPAPYPQAALTAKEIQGRKVYFPLDGGEKGWYAPLPCAYLPAKFALRGERIADGFKPQIAP